MTNPVVTLREIHRLKKHAKNLQDEIDRSPRLLKAQQAKLAKSEEAIRQAQDDIKKAKVKQHEKETDLKAAEQQIGKYEQQRNQAQTKKEYDAFNAEISSAKRLCRKLEDDILDAMGAVESKTALLPELEQALKKAKDELDNFEQTSKDRAAGLAAQLKQAQADLAQIEAQLPTDIQEQYTRLVNYRGEDALSLVGERTCTACYTSITAQNYNDLLVGAFVVCKSCGRILYLPE